MVLSRRDFGKGAVAGGLLAVAAACGASSRVSDKGTTVPSSTTTLPAPAPTWKPTISDDGHHRLTANGARLKVAGVIVMGVPCENQFTADFVTGTGSFKAAEGQYPNRDVICATVKAWGGNAIRLKFASTDIAAKNFRWSTDKYLQCIVDWVRSAKAHGLYTTLTDWSTAGSPPKGRALAAWPDWLPVVGYPVWREIAEALKLPDGTHDPYVWWEPLNEPADVSWSAWLRAYESIATYFRRTIGYTGVLVCDGLHGSSSWQAASFEALGVHDAGLPGMGKVAQVAFANHDYALTSKVSSFRSANWLGQTLATSNGLAATKARLALPAANRYSRFETAFGNYVQGFGGNAHWSGEAASYFSDLYPTLPSYAGAYAYVWGPWSDANAIVKADNATPTSPWGTTVKRFLRAAGATVVPVAS